MSPRLNMTGNIEEGRILRIMYYTKMLHWKGVPLWAPLNPSTGTGKGLSFRATGI